MSRVRMVDGVPAVVLCNRDELHVLQSILHQVNVTERWRGHEPAASAVSFVRAARAAIALIDTAAPVPRAALDGDAKGVMTESWITTDEASRILGISARAVRKRVVAGTLIGRKVGRDLLIDSKELVADAAA